MTLVASLRHAVGRRVRSWRKRWRFERDGRLGPLPRPEKWVFIVGCYNSGTTLVHDLLATHPHIGSMPDEGQFLQDQLPVPRDMGLRRLWALEPDRFCLDETGGSRIDVERLKRQWGAHFNDATRPVLLEKSPTNAARTRWLQRHFENAYFIGIVRDGRAVVEGIRRKTGHDLEHAALQWARSNEIMLRDFDHLSRALVVRYERLTVAADAVLDEIAVFLRLPPLSAGIADRAWRIHEQTSVVRNMNDESIARLHPGDLSVIDHVAGTMLSRLGYSQPPPTRASGKSTEGRR